MHGDQRQIEDGFRGKCMVKQEMFNFWDGGFFVWSLGDGMGDNSRYG